MSTFLYILHEIVYCQTIHCVINQVTASGCHKSNQDWRKQTLWLILRELI